MGETLAEALTLIIVAAVVIRLVWVRVHRTPPAQDPADLGDVLARGKDKQRRFGSSEGPRQDGGVDEMGAK